MLAVVAAATLAPQGTALAGLVSQNDASLPGSIDGFNYTLDQSTGWRWLDLTITVNQSFDDVYYTRLAFGGDLYGFRYATRAEVQTMLSAVPGAILFYSSAGDGGAFGSAVRGVFGDTSASGPNLFWSLGIYLNGVSPPAGSGSWLDVLYTGANLTNGSSVYYDASPYTPQHLPDPSIGSWLVDVTPSAAPVPEPSSVVIATVLFAVFGVPCVRRRIRRKSQPVTELG